MNKRIALFGLVVGVAVVLTFIPMGSFTLTYREMFGLIGFFLIAVAVAVFVPTFSFITLRDLWKGRKTINWPQEVLWWGKAAISGAVSLGLFFLWAYDYLVVQLFGKDATFLTIIMLHAVVSRFPKVKPTDRG